MGNYQICTLTASLRAMLGLYATRSSLCSCRLRMWRHCLCPLRRCTPPVHGTLCTAWASRAADPVTRPSMLERSSGYSPSDSCSLCTLMASSVPPEAMQVPSGWKATVLTWPL